MDWGYLETNASTTSCANSKIGSYPCAAQISHHFF